MAEYHPVGTIKVYQTAGCAPCYEELSIPPSPRFFHYFSSGSGSFLNFYLKHHISLYMLFYSLRNIRIYAIRSDVKVFLFFNIPLQKHPDISV